MKRSERIHSQSPLRSAAAGLFGLAALVIAALSLYLCVYASGHQARVEDSGPGSPTETIQTFFQALQAGDWAGADACLEPGNSLGLDQVHTDQLSTAFWAAQCGSWGCRVEPGYTLEGPRLQKTLQVDTLDLPALGGALAQRVQDTLNRYTQEARLASEVYDESGAYRQEVAQRALEESVRAQLDELSAYGGSQALTLSLTNLEGHWYIHPDSALMRALTSGAAGVVTAPAESYDMYINNLISGVMDGLIPIKKVYFLDESLVIAPEPNQDRFGESLSAADTQPILDAARELLDGQSTIWTPETPLYDGTPVRWYLDDTILSITWQQALRNTLFTFSEIKIAHPSQFRRYLADDTFSASRQYLPSQMAATVNAVTALSGDFHKFRNMGHIVYRRQLCRCAGKDVDTCMVDSSGDLHFVYRGQLTDEADVQRYIEENDILFSLAFGPVLLDQGERVLPKSYPIGEINDSYARSVLCQLGPLHYLLVTANCTDDLATNHLIKVPMLTDVLEELGVPTAYTLDGGQTAALITHDQLINPVQFGYQRAISDIIYFATAIPSD